MPTALASRFEDRLASSAHHAWNVVGLVRCPRENEEERRISPDDFAAPEALQWAGGAMPINPDLRHLYPPDWRALANWVKFERAGGRCEWCGRPHGARVLVIGEGGWLDPATGERFDERGRSLGCCQQGDWPAGRFVTTILTCAHLDQNPANNDPANLASLCPRCHLRHDRRQHIQSAYRNRRRRWAIKDLFD